MFRKNLAHITIIFILLAGVDSVIAEEQTINEKFKIESGSLELSVDIDAAELIIKPSGNKSELTVTAEYDYEYSAL